MFHTTTFTKLRKISFNLTGDSWKSATIETERPANYFSGIIINISPKFESISDHRSIDTLKCPSIINNFTSSNFLKQL